MATSRRTLVASTRGGVANSRLAIPGERASVLVPVAVWACGVMTTALRGDGGGVDGRGNLEVGEDVHVD